MLRPATLAVLLTAFFLSSLGGCVKRSTYEGALTDIERARAERDSVRVEMEDSIQRLQDSLATAAREHRELRERAARLEEELRRLEDRRSQMEERFEEARQEVHRLEAVLRESGSDYQRLLEQLQSLRAIQREIRQRNEIYEEVLSRFRSLIDGGRLSVSIDRGRMVIHLPQDVLFPSGSATLSAEGRRTLSEVASVLAELEDRRFQVEGHTDNVPIATSRFPSNWELSSARALSVVHLLVENGVAPENLSGAGYGEFQPVASNDDPEGRRRNRRIEIVMLPNLDVIAEVQGLP